MERYLAAAAAFLMAGGMGLAGSGTSTATESPAPVTPSACGYYHTKSTLYYNHCGSGKVVVYVKNSVNITVRTLCLPPGESNLGEYKVSNFKARSDGKSCDGGSGSW